jgi:hypothetical protein
VPAAAARLSDVGARDPHPLELGRCRQHPLQLLAVGGLDPRLLPQRHPRLADPLGELVAQPLQLTEVEQPRGAGAGADPVLELDSAEGLADEATQLALETGNLTPQLGPREPLIDARVKCLEALS